MEEIKSIEEINLKEIKNKKNYHRSPEDWEDQVIYFLIVDRFSDGEEDKRDLFNYSQDFDSIKEDDSVEEWLKWGEKWNGGNLQGVISKLDYLKKMGVNVIWLSPIFKQVSFQETYHGYGIQNFLEVDPHLGSKEDLKELVKEAHKRNIYVILDIILNHSGDVFAYEEESPAWTGDSYNIKGFRDKSGNPNIVLEDIENKEVSIDGAVWPKEMQNKEIYERKGQIQNWDYYPEYVEGDFMSLKTHFLGDYNDEEGFVPSKALNILTKVYKYWIAETDIDGYRLDTVKHLEWGATKHFVREIHEFAKSIGKKNFYLIGEITGGFDFAYNTLNKTGLDAALGINDIPHRLEGVAKGHTNPQEYFDIFTNTELLGEDDYKWFKDNVVTMFDDHDMVSLAEDHKYRFSAEEETSSLLLNSILLNMTTLGIPCLYYGTEQGFDGSGDHDKYIRECMFGGKFGAFRSQNKHFFNEKSDIYQGIKKILNLRKENVALRHGRQYLRPISYKNGQEFYFPTKKNQERIADIIAWSRVLSEEEYLLAINSDLENKKEAYIKIDPYLNDAGDKYECIYSSVKKQIGEEAQVENIDGTLCIKISIENKGRVVYKKL